MKSVLVYSVLRLLAFVVPFGVLMMIPFFRQDPWYWVAVVCAALIGLSLSVLFLNKPLSAVSTEMAARRAAGPKSALELDSDAEDAEAEAEAAEQAAAADLAGAGDADLLDAADTTDVETDPTDFGSDEAKA